MEQLGVEHTNDEVEGTVIVRDAGEDYGFLLAQTPQIQFVCLSDTGQGFQVELLQSGNQRDLNGLQGFGTAGAIVLVVFQGDMLRVLHFQPIKEFIQGGVEILHVLPDFTGPDHFHNHGEVLLFLRCFIMQIENKRQKQHGCSLVPEGVLGLTALGGRILEQIGDKPLDIIVRFEIDKRIVAMAFLHVDQIQHLDVVTLFL